MRHEKISQGLNPDSMKISYVIDEMGELLEALKCLRQLAGGEEMRMVAYHLHLAWLEARDVRSRLGPAEKSVPGSGKAGGGYGARVI